MKRALLALIIILTIGVVMSLHDVDKTSSNRITSILNSADDVQQRMAQGTSQVQNAGEEESDGLRTLERQIMAVQDGTNKAVFGFYGTANKFGFKVAEDGVDVLTASDDQLLFNSEQNVFKIVKTGTATLTPPSTWENYASGLQTATIPHNLGYSPAFLVYGVMPVYGIGFTEEGLLTSVPQTIIVGDGRVHMRTLARSDSTNLYIHLENTTSGDLSGYNMTWNFRYYILQETAN